MTKENISCTVTEAKEILGFNLLETLTSRGLIFSADEEIEIIFHNGYIVVWDNEDGETIEIWRRRPPFYGEGH